MEFLTYAFAAAFLAVIIYVMGRDLLESAVALGVSFLLALLLHVAVIYVDASTYEILGGEITAKDIVYDPETERYQCGTTQSCSTSTDGKRTCHNEPKYCERKIPRWRFDIDSNVGSWYDYSYNKHRPPEKWLEASVGDPFANTKYFVNFQQTSKQTITLNTQVQYEGWLPEYPDIYGSWHVDRAISNVIDVSALNKKLEYQHRHWGPNFGVNTIVTIVNADAPGFNHALASKWKGGKKNDVVLTIYLDGNTVKNVELFSRSTSTKRNAEMADFATALREGAMAIGEYNDDKVIKALGEALPLFEREDLSKYDYLADEKEVPAAYTITILVIMLLAGYFGAFMLRSNDYRRDNPYMFWQGWRNPWRSRKHPDFR